MAVVPAAFPFIDVRIDTSGLTPVAQRSPGVIAIVGKTADGANGGAVAANTPEVVSTLDDAATFFANAVGGVVASTPLYQSFVTAMEQDPGPSKMYGVRVAGDDYASALASLEAVTDTTFVALANETSVGAATAGAAAATGLMALKEHVERMSSQGLKRIGVAMIDPTQAKTPTYVNDVAANEASLKSDSSRMVLIAARGTDGDAAVAAMAAIAGYSPEVSVVLKRISGITIPTGSRYSPSEIKGLSEASIIPIIHPSLIVGDSLHFGEGRTFTTDADLLYIDIVRVLDQIDFELKAGLIGAIGSARITKVGMTLVKLRVDGILQPLVADAVIADYSVDIPVLDILNRPESTWTPGDQTVVQTARANRAVDMFVSITYGPAVHHLHVTLAPKF